MNKAFATYTFNKKSIFVDLESTNHNIFRSFRLDRGSFESQSSLYNRAYTECDLWAQSHGLQLEVFRAG
jgi:hypothetical protein